MKKIKTGSASEASMTHRHDDSEFSVLSAASSLSDGSFCTQSAGSESNLSVESALDSLEVKNEAELLSFIDRLNCGVLEL